MQKVFMKWIRNAALTLAVTLIGASTGLAQVSVDLSQLVGRPGESGVVAVSISDVESGTVIESYGFDIVTTGAITFTGFVDDGALTGDAGFSSATGLAAGLDKVAGFAQGTNIETSGTLIYLTFDFDAVSSGTITLVDFLFNTGDPAIANDPPSGDFVVSNRMLKVEDHLALPEEGIVHEDDEFTIKIFVEDAFETGDVVVSFGMEIHYDPAVFTIDKSRGANGIITSGTMNSTSVVNANDAGGEDSGVYLVAGFVTGDPLVGTGVLFELAAIAGNEPGIGGPGQVTVFLSDVLFNTGSPLYGAFPGTIIVFPFNVATDDEPETPAAFVLDGNYPNPFNPTTNIQFDLPEASIVSIQVMDLLGREVLSVPAQNFAAGLNQTITINAGNLTSGLYLYRVVAKSQTSTSVKVGSMTLLK